MNIEQMDGTINLTCCISLLAVIHANLTVKSW